MISRTPREELERGILSCLMKAPDALPEVQDQLTPEHFSSGGRQLVYEAMLTMQAAGQAVELATLHSFLSSRVESPGLATALTDLAVNVAMPSYLETYVTQLKVAHTLQGVSELCQRGAMAVNETEHTVNGVQELVSGISKEIDEQAGMMVGRSEVNLADTLQEIFDSFDEESEPGISTGLYDVDQLLNNLQPGKLIIVAGRPAMGKSAFALTIARHMAKDHHVAMWSMEMTRQEIVQRLLAQTSGVDLTRIISKRMDTEQRTKLMSEAKAMQALRLTLSDEPSVSPAAIRAHLRRALRVDPIKVVIVDYLQIMHGGGKTESRNIEIGQYSRELKRIAMEFKIPVIALAQLSRQVEARTSDLKPCVPRLSDLRDSGSIEQDADAVLFLYRPWIYDPNGHDEKEAEVICAKNRNGATGTKRLFFRGPLTRFDSVVAEETIIHA